MRTKTEIKKAISFFSGTDWPVYVSQSVALRAHLHGTSEPGRILNDVLNENAVPHGVLLVDEVRRLRRELRKQIKGNQRLSRALGLIIEHKGPVLKMQGDPPEVTKEWNWVNTSPPDKEEPRCHWVYGISPNNIDQYYKTSCGGIFRTCLRGAYFDRDISAHVPTDKSCPRCKKPIAPICGDPEN